jgi:hypothetical protein
MPLKSTFDMIDRGEIIDCKTIAGLLYLKVAGYIDDSKLI